jgi:hypothetical protein
MLAATTAVLLFVIALLAIPITFRFELCSDESRRNEFSLRWAFGLVRVRIPIEKTEKSSVDETAPKKERKPRKRRSSRWRANPFPVLTFKRFRRRIIRFVRDIWRAIHKDDISVRVRLGLGDPAETGQLWAVVGPIAGILAAIQQASISIEPVFVETIFELEASGRIRFIPLQLLYLIAALFLSPAVWRAMRQMRSATQ